MSTHLCVGASVGLDVGLLLGTQVCPFSVGACVVGLVVGPGLVGVAVGDAEGAEGAAVGSAVSPTFVGAREGLAVGSIGPPTGASVGNVVGREDVRLDAV